jgi:hypothetical protein
VSVLFRWWRFAQAVVESVATPATDIARSDAACEATIRESGVFRVVNGAAAALDRAAATSMSAGALRSAGHEWRTASSQARVLAAGLATIIASAVPLALWKAGPVSAGRYMIVIPVIALAAGLIAVAGRRFFAGILNRLDS